MIWLQPNSSSVHSSAHNGLLVFLLEYVFEHQKFYLLYQQAHHSHIIAWIIIPNSCSLTLIVVARPVAELTSVPVKDSWIPKAPSPLIPTWRTHNEICSVVEASVVSSAVIRKQLAELQSDTIRFATVGRKSCLHKKDWLLATGYYWHWKFGWILEMNYQSIVNNNNRIVKFDHIVTIPL